MTRVLVKKVLLFLAICGLSMLLVWNYVGSITRGPVSEASLGTRLVLTHIPSAHNKTGQDTKHLNVTSTATLATGVAIPQHCPTGAMLPLGKAKAMFGNFSQKPPESNITIPMDKTILILTPVSNAARHLTRYFSLLCSLSYPHELITIALCEDSSRDKTLEIAIQIAQKLKGFFHKIEVFQFPETLNPPSNRHNANFQLERRGHLAKARNYLLSRATGDEDWVLWIDSDVAYYPPDLIQYFLAGNKDVMVPSCMYIKKSGKLDVYDRNTWRETPQSLAYLKRKESVYLMLEGYSDSLRIYLPALKMEGLLVPIDGVGGCVLMVRAECHRKGLNFPAFVFEHHIETEGLAKLAHHMEFSVYGLPGLQVFH